MDRPGIVGCCFFLLVLDLLSAGAGILAAAFAFVRPVEITVDEASLGRFALAEPRNGTASLSYDLSFAVAVHNHNWAMRVWRTAPLDAELRFGGQPIHRVRLVGEDGNRIRPLMMMVYRVAMAAESAPVALGSYGAREFARESASGVFKLELIVTGEVRYQAHYHRHGFKVSCPLKLSLSLDGDGAGGVRECRVQVGVARSVTN